MPNDSKISPYVRPVLLGFLVTALLVFPLGFALLALFLPAQALEAGMVLMKLLSEIPEEAWTTFQVLFLGYSIPKSAEKITKLYRSPLPAIAPAPSEEETAPWNTAK